LQYAVVLVVVLSAVAAMAVAAEKPARGPFADADHVVYMPARGVIVPKAQQQIVYHNGPVIVSAKVVFIFWGPSFSNAASPDFQYAKTLQDFRSQFGNTPEFNTITQYTGTGQGAIQLASLGSGTADLFDTSTPPTNVTDAIVQSKVQSYLSNHTFDASTIYEVVLPSSSYSSSGTSTSCGGPHLAYCAYHSWIGSGANAIKYSIEPYPSCSGCKVAGWTDAQNQEHFVCHETREAVTDPTGTGWWDRQGAEADDKCAWSPTPFIGTGGHSYQYEWSNASRACVKTR
jgi:hypothetical protein